MDQQWNSPDNSSMMTPPLEGGFVEEKHTKWPTVIGVISIIYAGGGLLCAVGTAIGSFFMEGFFRMGGMDVTVPTIIKVGGVITGLFLLTLGIIMLAGAINTLRRKRSGPSMLRAWAILRISLILFGLVWTILTGPAQIQFQRSMLEAQEQKLREAGRPAPATVTDEQLWRSAMINAAVFSGLIAIYPAFLGIYLSRRKIKDEVGQWR